MKKLSNYLLVFGMLSLIACGSSDPIDIEETTFSQTKEKKEEEKEEIVFTTKVCESFDWTNIVDNKITIDCIVDLNKTTIDIPSNTSIVFDGGDITNGTLNFADNVKIDGNLLNSSLSIKGKPTLLGENFNFIPNRWGIAEGKIDDAVATQNTNIINRVINLTKDLGANTFYIDKIDAYFNVAKGNFRHNIDASIFIPSDFHFKMGGNTNLRTQPNGFRKSVLIYSRSTENVKISGGKLWGDRYTHDYKTITGRHDWGHIIMLRGVQNSTVDDVEMHQGVGDGLQIGGSAHRNNDGSIKPNGRESRNVTVRNCLMDDNRRNNISVVDGTDIYIEYNTIKNAGSGDDSEAVSSNGTSPRAGIDIEAFKKNAPDNNSVYDWEKTERIHIRNNTFEDNYAVDVALYNGEKTYVYENTFRSQRCVSAAYSYNNQIYNNRFERPEGLMNNSKAIEFESRYWENGTHRIKDNLISNNTFTGYQFAIVAGGQGHLYKDNKITNCQRGIVLITSDDLEFDNNIIKSDKNKSNGYYTFSTELSIKNCLIKNGETDVQGLEMFISNTNNKETGNITIDNIDFKGEVALTSAQNITIKNSTFKDIIIKDCTPTLINNN